MATSTEIKDNNNTLIRVKTTAKSITKGNVADQLDSIVDYADQQDALKVDKVVGKSLVLDTDITKLTNLSGTNTGDETVSTIKTKLGITTLSGSNTGDQDLSGLELLSNKSTNITIDATSDTKYPSVKAVKTYVDNKSIGLPYDSYAVSLSQTGTNAPTETYIFENTIGAIVWTYNGVGIYIGTLASAFPIAKTFLLINQNKAGKKITLEQISASQVKIYTLTDAGVNENNVLNLTSIEIRVYN